jgi:hypothetical protein
MVMGLRIAVKSMVVNMYGKSKKQVPFGSAQGRLSPGLAPGSE